MNKKQADYLLRRIYKALEDNTVRVRFNRRMKKILGLCTWEDDHVRITLNPDEQGERGGMMSTIIHECLHMVRSDLDEEDILKMEEEMFALLTDRQLGNLLRRVAGRMCKRRD